MAKAKKNGDGQQVIHYQHADDMRTNIPTAVIAGQAPSHSPEVQMSPRVPEQKHDRAG
ncbi:MAG: hypothetical protein ABSF77_11965 [Spirochaetia bacterium]|jgi:hypothetical protein